MKTTLFWSVLILCFFGPHYAQSYFITNGDYLSVVVPENTTLQKVSLKGGNFLKVGDKIHEGDFLARFQDRFGNHVSLTAGVSGELIYLNEPWYQAYKEVPAGTILLSLKYEEIVTETLKTTAPQSQEPLSLKKMLRNLVKSTGVYALIVNHQVNWTEGLGRLLMMFVALVILYLGIAKKFEPLLLIPIGMGALLANIPMAYMGEEGGILYYIYVWGIKTGIFPLIIFMGIGAMTDFGPMLANPRTTLLGAAAQLGIFATLFGAVLLSKYVPGIEFSLKDAASIAIIGGADGPTSIFLASKLSPRLLGSIAIAAYSYMALVPLIQPPIMRLLTTEAERKIRMSQLRYVSRREKILFPILTLLLCAFLLPSAAPLIGFFMFGNLMQECGVIQRLSETTKNTLINVVTIFLGLGVGSQLSAEQFLHLETIGILFLGLLAFCCGTAGGVLMAKFMNLFLKNKLNPLIGSSGVSAVPMAARVSNKLGLEADPQNFLLMHAMGPNVAGVLGSAVAAGVLLAVFS